MQCAWVDFSREADATIYLKAGAEIGVCSTKAFTSQLMVLSLFTLLMARMRHMSKGEGQHFYNCFSNCLNRCKSPNQAPMIAEIAKKYAKYENFFYHRPPLYVSRMPGRGAKAERDFLHQCQWVSGR